MKTPPNILDARIVGPLTVEIDWSTGETLSVHLSDFTAPHFDALRNPEFFAQLPRDAWGHGLDMGADRLYQLGWE